MSAYTSYVITEADKKLMLQRELRYMIKIEVLDLDYKILDSIEGTIIDGSYNIDSTSDIRRTTSFSINPTVLAENSPLRIAPLGYIWFDKIIHFYIGLMDIVTEEFTYYSEGYYLFVNISSSYDVQNNELNVTLNDYMAVFNGTRNGQIGTAVVIPAYEYIEHNDGHIEILKYNLLRDAFKTVIVHLGKIPYDKVLISEMGATNGLPELQKNYLAYRRDYPYWASVPYDQEFGVGTTVLQIVDTLRDLYPNYETFFSPDNNTFICQLIPSGYEEPVTLDNDFIQKIVVSEQSTVDLSDVKNVCEVWGRVLDPKYYAPEAHSGNENILTIFEEYNEKLMTKLVDNLILYFETDMTVYQQSIDDTNTKIETLEYAITEDTATVNQLKSDITVYEGSVGKSVTLLRNGKESFLNDNKRTYYNYPFAYYDCLGYMSSGDYSQFTAILTAICKTYTQRKTLNDSETVWLRRERETLFTNAADSTEIKSRATDTYNLIVQILNLGLQGAIMKWCSSNILLDETNKIYVSPNTITETHVDTYLISTGYKNKIMYYDDEKKVAFIERLVNKGDTAYNAYFGSKASLARSRLQEEIGSYGIIYYNACKSYQQANARITVLQQQRTNAQTIISRYGSSSDLQNRIDTLADRITEILADMVSGSDYLNKYQGLLWDVDEAYAKYKEKKKNKASKSDIQKAKDKWEKAKQKLEDFVNTQSALFTEWEQKSAEITNLEKQLAIVKQYESTSASYDTEITNLTNNVINPAQNTMDIYRTLINYDESAMEASVTQIETLENTITANKEALAEEREDLIEYTESYNKALLERDRVTNYKNIITTNYSQLDDYIQANPSSPPSTESAANATAIIEAYEDLVTLYADYEGDTENISDLFKELSTTIDNVKILLNGYIINTTGEDMFTYKIELTDYTKYSDGDEIAVKVNLPNDSPATFLQVNTLPILPIFRSKSLTDEAAINNFIEQNYLRKYVTYVFKIVNVETTRVNRITGEEEEVTSLFAYLQGTYQLHGIDVLSDGRELTEYYYIQKVKTDGAEGEWSDMRKRISDGTDTTALIDEDMEFDDYGKPDMELALDRDGNPIYKYSREYFEYRYNCQNVHFTIVPDSPYTVERLGEILDVKSGDRYENCNTELEILENAVYENWKNCRLTDTVTITTLLCPFLDVNVKVTYKPRVIQINNTLDDAADDEPYEYLIKSVSHDLSGLTSTITMYRYYPLFAPDNDYPTVIR